MFQFDHNIHVLMKSLGSITSWLAREFPEDDLFVYLNRRFGTFTIARWNNKLDGMFVPLLVIGEVPSMFSREDAQRLTRRIKLAAEIRKEARGAVRDNEMVDRMAAEVEDHEFRDTYRSIRRAGAGYGSTGRKKGFRSPKVRDHPFVRAAAGLEN